MLRIILAGCHGRMGRETAALCTGFADTAVVAGLDPGGRPAEGFPVFSAPELCAIPADVLVDFSRPDALESLLTYCVRLRLPVVLAVTGYSDRQLSQIHLAAHTIPIFRAANLSVGANVLRRLSEQAAAALGDGYDAAVTERHHRRKLDSPSGTALVLANAITTARPLIDQVGISSIRAGTTAGEHTVLFAGQHEVLELTHRADSRDVYAAGAIRAARFLTCVTEPGLYGMEDLLS